MLSTMLLSTNEDRMGFENEQWTEKIKFMVINVMIVYTLRFCIACQMTSLVIEQDRKMTLKLTQIDKRYPKLKFQFGEMVRFIFCFCKKGVSKQYEDRLAREAKPRKKGNKK